MKTLEEMAAEIWEDIKDHPDDCECVDCYEYYILTQK